MKPFLPPVVFFFAIGACGAPQPGASLPEPAAIAVVSTFSAFAEPKEWLGKELPDLGVNYLGTAPEFKGKATIVEFWATWCPPCRASIPHLNEINKKFKDKGLVVIGISDETKEKVEKFQKDVPMEYHVAVGGAAIQGKFGINGIPHLPARVFREQDGYRWGCRLAAGARLA